MGFKIILPVGEGSAGDEGFSEQKPAHDLGEDELKPLDAAVKAGEVKVLAERAPASRRTGTRGWTAGPSPRARVDLPWVFR